MVSRLKAVLMNEHDRFVLQQMLNEQKRNVKNTRGRARTENSFVDGVDAQSVDHYIAYVEGTIPALVGEDVGTGTGSVSGPGGAMPGSALCRVYKIVNGVLRDAGFHRRVFNLTAGDISATWITCTKDKFGNWVANLGGPSTILVKITQTAPGTGSFGTGSGLGDPVAVYRTSHIGGFDVIALDENHDEVGQPFTCYADELVNAHYTDSLVRIQRFGDKWQVVTTGENHWHDAFTNDPIDVDGSGEVQMFDNGPSVQATTGMPVSQYVFCQLLFDSQAQVFYVGNQGCDTNNPGTGT